VLVELGGGGVGGVVAGGWWGVGWREVAVGGGWGGAWWNEKTVKETYALAAILALGILGCFATRAAAQEGKFTGTIIDFDGNRGKSPVKIKSDQGVTTESKTDAAGKFSFTGLKNGKYTFTVQPPQMQAPFDVPFEVHGADTPPINLNSRKFWRSKPRAAAKYKKQLEEQRNLRA